MEKGEDVLKDGIPGSGEKQVKVRHDDRTLFGFSREMLPCKLLFFMMDMAMMLMCFLVIMLMMLVMRGGW